MNLITLPDILAARDRIAGTAVRTPLVSLDPARLRAAGFDLPQNAPEIFLKDESAQPIGSFKLRGAYNKIASLTPEELRRGVITYSSGNHAQGVAFAARALGAKAIIVMPENAPAIKREATVALGAEIVTVGPASTERRQKAEELVRARGYIMVPPYDDPAIIAGQATCGLEILEQLAELPPYTHPADHAHPATETAPDLILSPVSGGGLLSGVATAIKLATAPGAPSSTTASSSSKVASSAPQAKLPSSGQPQTPLVFGVEPELAADAAESFRTRTLVEWPAAKTTRTLADGLRTQSLGELNFQHILQHVDGIVTVTEAEIRAALKIILHATDIVAEPSGAVTLAAALFHPHQLPAANRIVAIVSGGNLDPALRAELESEAAAAHV